ncbi:imidazole glycerol phosphate synthase subunit HisH [Bifidobacterium olomucense]|uniref:Imidazole glycerol phosphate synthase subunit HisH n=1 Tax=Bifidobacterium olomucense TaxID=2675324 RepID=A0A7Y0EWT5_9BIFI|nr:imidazole glycerol phosphate synthase subunit HisH [Bifidobacterium sp. DSM 109959]NMM97779.1 imidazole glycerol phosphate synthase subunit HisH [Bifidobacterium sp. DSM 109959]
MTTAVVFDYGFGNVRSMVRALSNLGVDTTLTSDYRQALEADGLVVPGVGAFAACMDGLKQVDGDRVIYDRIRAGRPVLGVCVGEQIMFEHGHEHGADAEGVGLIGGSVDLLDADVVPHMGWDTVDAAPGSVLLKGVEQERFYFVHSYAAMGVRAADTTRFEIDFADAPEHVSWCEYGRSRFVAAYEHGPLSATQFHPEKSGDAGAQLLKNWIATF